MLPVQRLRKVSRLFPRCSVKQEKKLKYSSMPLGLSIKSACKPSLMKGLSSTLGAMPAAKKPRAKVSTTCSLFWVEFLFGCNVIPLMSYNFMVLPGLAMLAAKDTLAASVVLLRFA